MITDQFKSNTCICIDPFAIQVLVSDCPPVYFDITQGTRFAFLKNVSRSRNSIICHFSVVNSTKTCYVVI